MIRNRPAPLLADEAYRTLLPPPYALDWGAVPEPIKLSLLTLDGIQPHSAEAAALSDGLFSAIPSAGEIDLHRTRGTNFQLIMVVVNGVLAGLQGEHPILRPYAITLIASSKRGQVTNSDIEFVASVAGKTFLDGDTAYVGMDPFQGDWQMWGEASIVVGDRPREGFMDELGLVTDHYFLAVEHDPNDVIMFMPEMPEALRERYFRHRAKLLFTPFRAFGSRRIWGVETPIELFVLEELARRALFPQPQMLILEDGSVFPSLYEMWHELEIGGLQGLITEEDFFFHERGIAVFCDGRHRNRRPQRERDAATDARLRNLGIAPVRLPAREIMQNLAAAADKVSAALVWKLKRRATLRRGSPVERP